MSMKGKAQEIETTDKFASGYINGTYMNKFKSIDGVLYAVGYEGTKDWILVRYPAGSRNTIYHVHPNCRRIARGAFEGASYLQEIYLPETVSFIGEMPSLDASPSRVSTMRETMCQLLEVSLPMPKNIMVRLRKSLVTTSLADFVQLMIKECRLSFIQTSQLKRLLSNDWNHEQEDHKGVV